MRSLNRPALLLSALTLGSALATPAFASDTQYWQTLLATAKLDDNVVLSNETVFRSSDARGFYEIENNLMVGYKFNKHITAYLGYTGDPLYSHGSYTTMENRFRQQVNFDNVLMIGKAKVSGRLRLEERWRDGFAGTAWRLRPYVKIGVPLAKKLTLNLSNETFIDLNTNTFQKVGGVERMRNAIMLSTPLSKHVNFDFGYLEQHGFVRNGADTNDHVLNLQLSANF